MTLVFLLMRMLIYVPCYVVPVCATPFPFAIRRSRERGNPVSLAHHIVISTHRCKVTGSPLPRGRRFGRRSRERGNPASLARYIVVQIVPVRVLGFNQPDLPLSFPFLDLLFPRDRALRRVVLLIPYERLESVLLREAFGQPLLVLPDALHQLRRHADV